MKGFVAALLFATGVDALVSRGGSCCFHLKAHGGPGGYVDQLGDGQNRIGQSGLPEGTYCIDGNGGLTDGQGRGCILTPPTTQFQCDVGASPTPGFHVGCHGALTHNGNNQFYACPTGDNGGFNIYTRPVAGQSKCVKITLKADKCHKCHHKPQGGCPNNLNGPYEFPHLIVPINSAMPNTAYGTQYNGKADHTISTIFNFDIPGGDAGKMCNFVFVLPHHKQLQTSSFSFSGSGGFAFWMLNGVANQGTTYNNAPHPKHDYGVTNVRPGHSYSIAHFPCPAGKTIAFEMRSAGSSIDYFQDFNPCPIGAYVTVH